MFNLIPWKKRANEGAISVHQAEPSRQDLGLYPGSFREEFESMMDRLFHDSWFGRASLPSLLDSPRFDWNWGVGWEDKETEFVFHADLPGFESEDFDVRISGNTLTIRAEHKEEKKETNGGSSYHRGSFSRTMTLPQGVEEDKIDARYHSGVLEVHVPKSAQAQGKRIAVSAN